MSIQVDPDKMRAIESGGYGFNGYIGGLPKVTYYTPDGRMIKAIAQIRGYVKRDKDGNVIETGSRDANLDKGWLPYKPQILKPFCSGCNEWHDTLGEIEECKAIQSARVAKAEVHARAEMFKESQDKDIKIDALEKQVNELKEMMQKFMEAQNR